MMGRVGCVVAPRWRQERTERRGCGRHRYPHEVEMVWADGRIIAVRALLDETCLCESRCAKICALQNPRKRELTVTKTKR